MKVHVCTYCGSPRVYADAYVSLNDPGDIRIYDQKYCDNCEGECSTTEVELPEDLSGPTIQRRWGEKFLKGAYRG